MASDWGCPPWVIDGADSAFVRWRWARRWEFWKDQLAKKQKREWEKVRNG